MVYPPTAGFRSCFAAAPPCGACYHSTQTFHTELFLAELLKHFSYTALVERYLSLEVLVTIEIFIIFSFVRSELLCSDHLSIILGNKCLSVSSVTFFLYMKRQHSYLCFINLFYVYTAGMLFLLAYSGVMFLLSSYAAATVISVMQTSSLVALIASKVPYLVSCFITNKTCEPEL